MQSSIFAAVCVRPSKLADFCEKTLIFGSRGPKGSTALAGGNFCTNVWHRKITFVIKAACAIYTLSGHVFNEDRMALACARKQKARPLGFLDQNFSCSW